ncbi:MAG: hypothetical protein NVS1B4_19030 [Gemmatimonadaceae bacterium]
MALLIGVAPRHSASQGADGTRAPALTPATVDTTPRVTWGGFVDGYYAWDFARPYNFDRAYTTQPARHANFNINLAFVEARITGPRYRGRLALQWGTSVQANYASEPRIGTASGPSVSQFIQEATAGYQLARTLWVDGGIFFAHTGYEGWISRDNLAYSRSLSADFSPYYESGVKLTWTPTPALTTQIDLVNGWQNIANYNTPPAVGLRVDYALTPRLTLSYDNFVGNMAPDSAPERLRFFHELIVQYNPSAAWQLALTYDVGTQTRSTADARTAAWTGSAFIAKYHVNEQVAVVGRLESYADPSQVIVQTNLPSPFAARGASVGVDVTPVARLLWRSELRGLQSADPVWPERQARSYRSSDAFAVTSLALTF